METYQVFLDARSAYNGFNFLREELDKVLAGIGEEYQITFS